MAGDLRGIPLEIPFPEESFDYGVLGAAAEVSRTFVHRDGQVVMPYAEFGLTYEFERPDDAEIVAAGIESDTGSAVTGTLRAGVRMLINDSVQAETSGGYLSIGQNGLDIREGKLQVSVAF